MILDVISNDPIINSICSYKEMGKNAIQYVTMVTKMFACLYLSNGER